MSEEKKNDKEIEFEKAARCDFLFDSEDALMETENMSSQEKKEYIEFLWRRRLFNC